jgi:hypothetical protein
MIPPLCHARLQAAQLLVHRTAARFDAGIDSFQIAGEANMAKILVAVHRVR